MAKKAAAQNGRNRLDEAMALLIQNQASFLSRMADIGRATSERFARIEEEMVAIRRILIDHSRVLDEHSRLLERLPEAVRDKIGFKA